MLPSHALAPLQLATKIAHIMDLHAHTNEGATLLLTVPKTVLAFVHMWELVLYEVRDNFYGTLLPSKPTGVSWNDRGYPHLTLESDFFFLFTF